MSLVLFRTPEHIIYIKIDHIKMSQKVLGSDGLKTMFDLIKDKTETLLIVANSTIDSQGNQQLVDMTEEYYDDIKTFYDKWEKYGQALHENPSLINLRVIYTPIPSQFHEDRYGIIRDFENLPAVGVAHGEIVTQSEELHETTEIYFNNGYAIYTAVVNFLTRNISFRITPLSGEGGDNPFVYDFESNTTSPGIITMGSGASAEGSQSLSVGEKSTSKGEYSHAEGGRTHANGEYSHAEGGDTYAEGAYSHAEGVECHSSGAWSHAEGRETQAFGQESHAEGFLSISYKKGSHAEGEGTSANGEYSHTEGGDTYTTGNYSHAEGFQTTASGNYSHAEGIHTVTTNEGELACGVYNLSAENQIFSVGVGYQLPEVHSLGEMEPLAINSPTPAATREVRRNAISVYTDGNIKILNTVNSKYHIQATSDGTFQKEYVDLQKLSNNYFFDGYSLGANALDSGQTIEGTLSLDEFNDILFATLHAGCIFIEFISNGSDSIRCTSVDSRRITSLGLIKGQCQIIWKENSYYDEELELKFNKTGDNIKFSITRGTPITTPPVIH